MSVIPSSAVRRGRFDEEIMPLQQTKKNKQNRNAEGLDRFSTLSHPQERRHNIKVEKAADPLADTPNEANAGSTI